MPVYHTVIQHSFYHYPFPVHNTIHRYAMINYLLIGMIIVSKIESAKQVKIHKMKFDPYKYHRQSIRLKNYDYTQAGAYFITICISRHECLFGDIIQSDNDMHYCKLNDYGKIAHDEWLKTGKIHHNIIIDEFIIMPNHVHGILIIHDVGGTCYVGARRRRAPTYPHRIHIPCPDDNPHPTPTVEQFGKPVPNSIPTIIRSYKSIVTRRINQLRNTPGYIVWQHNYYEHVIRNNIVLNRIRKYIINNPSKWQCDRG